MKTLRVKWYPSGSPWKAVAELPSTSGFLFRYRNYIQGSAGGTTIKLYDSLGVDVLGGSIAGVAVGSTAGHLTAALSTDRGAMPRVFAGPTIFEATGAGGDETGVTEFSFADTLDLDESFGLGVCRVERRIVNWTSDSNGSAIVYFDGVREPKLRGVIVAIETMPDGGTPPKDDYDITLVDTLGQDVTDGLLANRSDTDPEIVYLWRQAAVDSRHQKTHVDVGTLELRVANAASGTTAAVGVYLAVPA